MEIRLLKGRVQIRTLMAIGQTCFLAASPALPDGTEIGIANAGVGSGRFVSYLRTPKH